MARLHLAPRFFDVLNRIMTAEDPLAALGLDIGLLDRFDLEDSVIDLEAITIQSASPARIVVALPLSDQPALQIALTGSGMGPLTSVEDFFGALLAGTATGSLSTLTVAQGAETLATASFDAGGVTVDAGTQSLRLDGTIPATLAGISRLLAVTALFDPESLAEYDAEERADLVAALSGLSLGGLRLSEGGQTLASLTLGAGTAVLALPLLRAELTGALPADLGELAARMFAAIDGGQTGPLALILALGPQSLRVTDPAGAELLRGEGPFDSLATLELVIDGVELPPGTPLVIQPDGDAVSLTAPEGGGVLIGTLGDDLLQGGAGDDLLLGGGGRDRLFGGAGDDTLHGGDGTDTLNGGDGDDFLFGGSSTADLRDVIYGGDGDDWIDGGWGNDELWGGAGNDTILGDYGSDTLIGNEGHDQLHGGAGSDEIHGGPGNDWINGGWGYDRLNGGAGADTFFHQGVADHGSDWVQDYRFHDGDVLAVGIPGAVRSQFQVNFANTPSAGSADVAEAFVIHRPTQQILFALVDGAGQDGITLRIGGQDFDLLA